MPLEHAPDEVKVIGGERRKSLAVQVLEAAAKRVDVVLAGPRPNS
jgi:hypothetical protein